jgi:hypothetical protein
MCYELHAAYIRWAQTSLRTVATPPFDITHLVISHFLERLVESLLTDNFWTRIRERKESGGNEGKAHGGKEVEEIVDGVEFI